MEARFPLALEEWINWFRRYEEHGGHVAVRKLHLLHSYRMRDEGFIHLEAETTEDHRAGKCCRRSLRVEVNFLAHQVAEGIDAGPHKDMHFRWKQVEDVGDPLLDIRHL